MSRALLIALSGALCVAATPVPPAQAPDLRARLETVLRTEKALKVPPDIDRVCVIDKALLAHPKVSKLFDGKMAGLFAPKDKKAELKQRLAEVKDVMAVASGIDACTPKPAKGAKAAR